MKNLFIIGLLGLLCIGCDNIPKTMFPYSIINVEGCQYITYYRGICHKGDCTNNIHIYNHKEKTSLEEIIDNPLIRHLVTNAVTQSIK